MPRRLLWTLLRRWDFPQTRGITWALKVVHATQKDMHLNCMHVGYNLMCVRMSMIYIHTTYIYIYIDIYWYILIYIDIYWYLLIYIDIVCVYFSIIIYIDQVTFTFISVINDMYIHVYTRACARTHPCFYISYISVYLYAHLGDIGSKLDTKGDWISLPSDQSTTFRWGFVDVLVNLISSCLSYLRLACNCFLMLFYKGENSVVGQKSSGELSKIGTGEMFWSVTCRFNLAPWFSHQNSWHEFRLFKNVSKTSKNMS